MPFEFAFGRKPLATALIVGGLLALSAPAAHAQFFNFFFHSEGLDPSEVQGMLEDRGLALVAPLRRNGGVYVADVEGPRGRLRLIVDAESGRIVQRFRIGAPHYYSDYNGPRPPAEMSEPDSNSAAIGAPPAVITFGQSLARGDDATSSPNVLSVPNGGEEGAKLRPKPQVKPHKKIELTPVPQQPAQSASSPPPEAKPPVHAEAASPAAPAANKAAAAPAPPPAAAPSPVPAAPAASNKPKPAVNDVPVTPLD